MTEVGKIKFNSVKSLSEMKYLHKIQSTNPSDKTSTVNLSFKLLFERRSINLWVLKQRPS